MLKAIISLILLLVISLGVLYFVYTSISNEEDEEMDEIKIKFSNLENSFDKD